VFIAGEEIASLEGDVETASIDTMPYNGSVLLRLVAENRGTATEETRDIFIYPPMTIESFTVTPDSVVRDVVTALTISWNAPGAVLTRISGLDTFTNAPLQSSYEGGTNTLEGIGGIAGDALAITLFAEDALGNTLEQTLDLTLSNPTCTAQSDVSLHEGPDPRHQVLGTLRVEETVIVNAQDAEAGWLRVELPGDITGWGEKTVFVCSENFALSDLRTELDVLPPPTPVPTQLPTSTPLPTVIPTATGQ
ncbi:MAG: SH3 domain-containing protein, partial [Aggregatilineales bacterium]